jgi:hypothetical protein
MTRRSASFLQRVSVSMRLRRPLGLVWQSAPGWTVLSVSLVLVQGIRTPTEPVAATVATEG